MLQSSSSHPSIHFFLCTAYFSALKVEAAGSSQTLEPIYRTAWHDTPENHNLDFSWVFGIESTACHLLTRCKRVLFDFCLLDLTLVWLTREQIGLLHLYKLSYQMVSSICMTTKNYRILFLSVEGNGTTQAGRTGWWVLTEPDHAISWRK
jgi:hypothetical protein